MIKRKSFLLYDDLYDTIQYLNDEQLGRLMRMVFDYKINNVVCDVSDPLFFCFNPVRVQLDRDDIKYRDEVEKRSIAGKASAESRANKKQHMLTHVESVQQEEQVSTNPTDIVNVSVSDNESESDILTIAKAIVVEDKKKTKKNHYDYKSRKYFNDEEANELIIAFFDQLVSMRKRPTEVSVNMTMKKLKEATTRSQIIESLERAIAGQYHTIFINPAKATNKHNEPKSDNKQIKNLI